MKLLLASGNLNLVCCIFLSFSSLPKMKVEISATCSFLRFYSSVGSCFGGKFASVCLSYCRSGLNAKLRTTFQDSHEIDRARESRIFLYQPEVLFLMDLDFLLSNILERTAYGEIALCTFITSTVVW